jgi:hypothetical protein
MACRAEHSGLCRAPRHGRVVPQPRRAGRGSSDRAGTPRGERASEPSGHATRGEAGGGAKAVDVEGRRERLGGEREITCVGG